MSDEYRFEEEEFETQFNGKTLGRLFQYARVYWRAITGFLVLIVMIAFLDSLFTYLSKLIIDEGILAGDVDRLMQLIGFYASLVVLQALGIGGIIYLTELVVINLKYDMRQQMFQNLQRLSLSYFNKTPVGWIMARLISDSERISEMMAWGLLDTAWGLLVIITALGFMFYINWQLALVMLFILPLLVIVASYFKRKILVEYRAVRKLNSQLTGVYNENITGIKVAKALTREEKNLREFDDVAARLYHSAYRVAVLSALFLPVVQLIGSVALGVVVAYGGWQTQYGGMTIGGIQAFISYLFFMLYPIQELSRVYAELQSSIASAERIFSLIDAEPEVVDRPEAFDPGTIRGDIEFDHVDFYYDADKPVLHDFSLHVQQGETIALVGPTGGGKSTIVNLVCRFYEPKAGVIRIGGTDYTQLKLHAIQARVGMVLQTPHLFSGTIRDNIRYGRLDATDAEVEAAAKVAHAHEFISTYEQGYDQQVGEDGVLLSTGQKQLISLARAVLAQPDIFIMDEATSSVDTLTEALIQQGMEALMQHTTSFVIAHRLSTIRKADRILVIEKGQIAEMGTHAELIRAGGHYHALYTRQFQRGAQDMIDEVFQESHEAQPIAIAGGK